MIGKAELTQALALIAGDMAGRIPTFEIRSHGHDAELPSLSRRPGEPVNHFRNRLMNRRNPNRTCKLLRRIKTTC